MAEIYLHIGTNKTGSSAIQSFFHKNRADLLSLGILYPETGLGSRTKGYGYHYLLSSSLGFPNIANGRVDDPDLALRLKRELKAEIKAKNPQKVLLSSEFFVLKRDITRVKHFLSDYNASIVVYLRRHDSWWSSLYSQAVRSVENPPWRAGFENYYQHQLARSGQHVRYGELLDGWTKHFGKERILPRPYEAAQNQPNIIHDILKTIGGPLEAEQLYKEDVRVNPSLSMETLSIIDTVQRSGIDRQKKNRIIRKAMEYDKLNNSRLPIIPGALRRQIIADNEDDYRYIAQMYLGRPDGLLYTEPLPKKDELKIPKNIPRTRIVEFFAHFSEF